MSKYTYKYPIYPTITQKILFAKHFGCVRYIYNHFLEQRINHYKSTKKSQSCHDNIVEIPLLKKHLLWLKEVNSQSLQYAVECLQNAYDHFFRRLKERKEGKKVKPGFPVFKNKYDKQSFRVKQGIKVINNLLFIPKFLEGIKINLHRELQGTINFATITKNKSGNYFVAITVTKELDHLPKNNKAVGIDLNIQNVVDSNAHKDDNPKPDFTYEKQSRQLAKAISRTKPNTKGREKAKRKYAKFKQYCHNIREDFLHKVSYRLVNENQVICGESLSVAEMLETNEDEPRWKQKKLHGQLQDCAFYSLIAKVKYKAQWYGRDFVQVSRWFPSSQICNKCKFRYHDLPKVCKEWICWGCFGLHDRDINAALNILAEGLRILRERTVGATGIADCPGVRLTHSEHLVGSETTTLQGTR